jgi:hypothetical protein
MNKSHSIPGTVFKFGLFVVAASTSFADVLINTLGGAAGSPASYATAGTVSSFNYGYLDETFQAGSSYGIVTNITLDLNFASASDTSTVYLYHVGDSSFTTVGTASATSAGEQQVAINSISYALNPNQAYAVILGTGAATGISWYDTSASATGGSAQVLYGVFLVSSGGQTQGEPGNFRMEIMVTPEPATGAIMIAGALAIAACRARRRKMA